MMQQTHLNNISSFAFGMDVIIISTTSPHERAFWQQRLDQMRGQIIKSDACVITVYEDWPSGAGNALGTFYAFKKAYEEALDKYHIDLIELLNEQKSIAIYHTAGKGTRLSPLTGSECNSKSRIKLAGGLYNKHHSVTPITILEAVIKQTAILAPHRKGRLCVFWGDQLFIPSIDINDPTYPIDLLVKPLKERPPQKEWEDHHYDRYGFVLMDDQNGGITQLEKLSYQEFVKMDLKETQKLALSLGSFSLSKEMLLAFLQEFNHELTTKTGCLDSDPHLWMPFSLNLAQYTTILEKKGIDPIHSSKHWERMQHFKNQFLKNNKTSIIMGSSSMGPDTFWWDYGNIQSFYENSLKILQTNEEAQALKQFFSIPEANSIKDESKLKVENSCLINCNIDQGTIKNSILINVTAHEVHASESVIISSCAATIEANQAILYNAMENGAISISPNLVRADSFSKEYGQIKLHGSMDDKLNWDQPVHGNPISFKELYAINQRINPDHAHRLTESMYNKIKQTVFQTQS